MGDESGALAYGEPECPSYISAEGLDCDDDGWDLCGGDCDDDDPTVNPYEHDVYDGADCDGLDATDADADG